MINLTADLHLYHDNIRGYSGRPYDSLFEMHEAFAWNWNNVVSHDDTTYILGDVTYGTVEDTISFLNRLNGKKNVVPGNHDRIHPMRSAKRKKVEWMEAYLEAGIGILWYEGELPEDPRFWLNHLPYEGDTQPDERFPEWRPDREEVGDRVLLHGHVHELFRRTKEKTLNVGVDVNNFTPVSLEEICREFSMVYKPFA